MQIIVTTGAPSEEGPSLEVKPGIEVVEIDDLALPIELVERDCVDPLGVYPRFADMEVSYPT